MFIRRALPALSRPALLRPSTARSFIVSARRYKSPEGDPKPGETSKLMKPFEEVTSEHDLLPPGAAPGTVPTDLEQATGLERLEIIGKMQGVDIFDMRPLDASRKGTLTKPIVVTGFGPEQYIGCTGSPADSHTTIWLVTSRDRPIERCPECGSVYQFEYVGPPDEEHHGHGDSHGHHGHADTDEGEPQTIADFVRAEYR